MLSILLEAAQTWAKLISNPFVLAILTLPIWLIVRKICKTRKHLKEKAQWNQIISDYHQKEHQKEKARWRQIIADYAQSDYFLCTHIPYRKLSDDAGARGEYRVYQELLGLSDPKKFLFNAYIPKENGDTTEIDIILLHSSGIYVIESKNYSGWVYGDETLSSWTQTSRSGYEKHFYNPLMQNQAHMKALRAFLKYSKIPFYSVIVFGNDCVLRDIKMTTKNHIITTQDVVYQTIVNTAGFQRQNLSEHRIDSIYATLR